MKAGGYLGLKDQQDAVGLHQDARDTEHEADAEGGLAKAARPVLGLPDEEQGAGEAAEQREEQEVGQLAVGGLDDGRVSELDEDTQHKGGQEDAQHCKKSESDTEGLGPRQKLNLLGNAGSVVLIGPEVIRALVTGARICKTNQCRQIQSPCGTVNVSVHVEGGCGRFIFYLLMIFFNIY